MIKKIFQKYTKKDAEEAEKFVDNLGSRDIPWLLNTLGLGDLKKYLEFYINRNDQYGFNRLASTYFKIVESGGIYSGKNIIKKGLKNLCRVMDKENIIQNKIKGVSAIDMLNKYNERVEVNVNYDINGYSPKEIMENIDYVSNMFLLKHRNLVNNLDKKWNNKGNRMKFKFESRGKIIIGDTKVMGDKIIINSLIPSVAKPYAENITNKIKGTLEDLFPKRNLETLTEEALNQVPQ
ncbi:MAG: hypothetical protein ACP5NZ_00435 [Nanobdellota archaeon]